MRLDVEQTRYDALLHWHEPLAGLEVLRGFLTYTDYSHDELEPGGELGTQYNNETWEGRLEIVHEPVGPLHGVFGVQAKDGQFSALGEECQNTPTHWATFDGNWPSHEAWCAIHAQQVGNDIDVEQPASMGTIEAALRTN